MQLHIPLPLFFGLLLHCSHDLANGTRTIFSGSPYQYHPHDGHLFLLIGGYVHITILIRSLPHSGQVSITIISLALAIISTVRSDSWGNCNCDCVIPVLGCNNNIIDPSLFIDNDVSRHVPIVVLLPDLQWPILTCRNTACCAGAKQEHDNAEYDTKYFL